MKKVLVILGPTATGKTDLGLFLAKKFNGELVSCDSRQVYRGLDIGTGKEASKKLEVKKQKCFWEIDGIKTWMYDVADPQTRYAVKDYVGAACRIIDEITQKGKLPIVVGGTGLYLRGLLDGFSNLAIPVDEKLRRKLQGLSLHELQKKLQELSPSRWEKMNDSDRSNPRRLLRSIELVIMYGFIDQQVKYRGLNQRFKILKIGLTVPREVLNSRIDLRLKARLDQGLVEEAKKLQAEGLSLERMKELGLEYSGLARLLGKEISREEMIKILSLKIHQYAKRQVTWFRKEQDVNWFDITKDNFALQVEKCVREWYYSVDEQTD